MELLCLEKENEPNSILDPVFLDDDRVLNNLLFLEEKYRLKECYFDTIQKDLTSSMRKEVSIWLLEVCMEEQCEEEVFPRAMCIMDRFLSLIQIKKSQLQLLATTCLLLSSKLVQNKTISTDRLVMFTDYSVTSEEIRNWEYLVLGKLDWDLMNVIPNNFLDLIIRRLNFIGSNKRTVIQKHAELFISLCASEFQFFNYLPSVIASACLALVLDIHCYKDNINEIIDCIKEITKIDSKTIEEAIDLIEDLIPSNRFHSTTDQSQRKRKNNKNRQLINLNDSDSENDLQIDESNLEINQQEEEFKLINNEIAINESSNQINNNSNLNSNNNEILNYSSLVKSIEDENLNKNDQILKNNNLDNLTNRNDDQNLNDDLDSDDDEIVLFDLDLTCFETAQPICNTKSICCN